MMKFQEFVAVEHQKKLGDVGREVDAVHLSRPASGAGAGAGASSHRASGAAALAVEPGDNAAQDLSLLPGGMAGGERRAQMGDPRSGQHEQIAIGTAKTVADHENPISAASMAARCGLSLSRT